MGYLQTRPSKISAKLALSERLPYVRNERFRNLAKTLPSSLIDQIKVMS